MKNEIVSILIREYLSKCDCCDECMAETFCILNEMRKSRVPQEYCEKNIEEYMKDLMEQMK